MAKCHILYQVLVYAKNGKVFCLVTWEGRSESAPTSTFCALLLLPHKTSNISFTLGLDFSTVLSLGRREYFLLSLGTDAPWLDMAKLFHPQRCFRNQNDPGSSPHFSTQHLVISSALNTAKTLITEELPVNTLNVQKLHKQAGKETQADQ